MSCLSQTREETVKWLIFYLDKFSNRPGHDLADSYYFEGSYIVRTDSGETQLLRTWKAIHINMSKVTKVEYVVDRTTDYANFQVPCLTITFHLNGYDSCMFIQDGETKRIISGPSPALLYSIYFYDPEVLKNNMPERITKALEYISALEGAPIIKEVF